jgi:TonB-linked SusC/RagA family outer membrane protein
MKRMILLKKTIFFLLMTAVIQESYSQGLTVSGIVTSGEDGTGIPGVTILVKGTNTGTTTDTDGNYQLEVADANAILVFSSVGFKSQEVLVQNRNEVNIILEPEIQLLDELIVIGYGAVKKSDLTGAVSSVKINEKDAVQFSSADALLRGRSAGVNVTSGNAAPGGAISVRIRGTNSFRNNNEPLYVIDGVIMNTATEDAQNPLSGVISNSSQEAQNGLSGINPQDIESMEILKDASATAIYGSRGANGVILITTKQGVPGEPKVSLSITTDFSVANRKIDVLEGMDYVDYRNELAEIRGDDPLEPDSLNFINWQDDVLRTAVSQNHRFTMSGGSNKGRYYLAIGYLDSQGLIKETGAKQGDLRLNLTQKFSDKFKVAARIGTNFRTNNFTSGTERLGSSNSSMIRQMISAPPFIQASELDDVTDDDNAFQGPRVWLEDYQDKAVEKRIFTSLNLDYTFTNSFFYRLQLGADLRDKERRRWFGKEINAGAKSNGALGISNLSRIYTVVENQLHFNKDFNNNHRINSVIATNLEFTKVERRSVANEDFFSTSLGSNGMGFGQVIHPTNTNINEEQLLGALGRLNYTFKDKYLFTLSGRIDGSSKFAPGNKFSSFYSGAFAWRVIEEPFLKNVNAVSDLKLRLGYGQTGSQAISPYQTLSPYSSRHYTNADGGLLIGASISNIANPDLKWETTTQYNAGMDFGLFKNRLVASFDVYHKTTIDLLQNINIPTSSGFNVLTVNQGSIENKGLELTLDGVILEGDFKWNVGGNISFNRNKILSTGLSESEFGTNVYSAFLGSNISNGNKFKSPANIFIDGRPLGLFYGFETDGIYQTEEEIGEAEYRGTAFVPGDVKYIDQDGDGNITDKDKVVIGDPNPKFNFGMNSNMRYKDFSLDIFLYGVYGNEIANGNLLREEDVSSNANIRSDAYFNTWKPDAPNNDYPRINYDNARLQDFTDRIVEDASFLRLGTVTLGYEFNLKKHLNRLNIYVTGRNLWTLSNYSGYDPEVNSFTFDAKRIGVDWQSYPMYKSILVGLNITF